MLSLSPSQTTREPLPAADVNKIWEDCKDDGVLLGKGGFYGNVCSCINIEALLIFIIVMILGKGIIVLQSIFVLFYEDNIP